VHCAQKLDGARTAATAGETDACPPTQGVLKLYTYVLGYYVHFCIQYAHSCFFLSQHIELR
jgi:hypothetical protein